MTVIASSPYHDPPAGGLLLPGDGDLLDALRANALNLADDRRVLVHQVEGSLAETLDDALG